MHYKQKTKLRVVFPVPGRHGCFLAAVLMVASITGCRNTGDQPVARVKKDTTVTNVKWIRRIELSDQPFMTREETSKYTEQIRDGKIRQFSFDMDARSVITFPA